MLDVIDHEIDHLDKWSAAIDEQSEHEYKKNLMINLIIYLTVSHALSSFYRIKIMMELTFFFLSVLLI